MIAVRQGTRLREFCVKNQDGLNERWPVKRSRSHEGKFVVQKENVYIVTTGGAAGIQSGLILAKLP